MWHHDSIQSTTVVLGTYELELSKTTRDVGIAQGQLRDYEARTGGAFAHEAYLAELTDLRHQLEAGLSGADTPVEEVVARIKALKASHTLEAARPATRATSIAEPVTARIRKNVQEETVLPPPITPIFGEKPKPVRQRKQIVPVAQLSLF